MALTVTVPSGVVGACPHGLTFLLLLFFAVAFFLPEGHHVLFIVLADENIFNKIKQSLIAKGVADNNIIWMRYLVLS